MANWQLEYTRTGFLKTWPMNYVYHKYLRSFRKDRFLSPTLVLEFSWIVSITLQKGTNKKPFLGEYFTF